MNFIDKPKVICAKFGENYLIMDGYFQTEKLKCDDNYICSFSINEESGV